MTFENRNAVNPGRIKLRNVQTGEETTYDIIMADDATTPGTPLTAEAFEQLKEEIINQAIEMGIQGNQGEPGKNGEKGDTVAITSITVTKV